MRIVLEWLGIVGPDRSRREPVAVPSWAPVAVATTVALLATMAVTRRLVHPARPLPLSFAAARRTFLPAAAPARVPVLP